MDIYINSGLDPLKKFSNCCKSSKFRDIPSQNISQMIIKTTPICTRIVYKLHNEKGNPFLNLTETKTITHSDFPIGGKVTAKQILDSKY